MYRSNCVAVIEPSSVVEVSSTRSRRSRSSNSSSQSHHLQIIPVTRTVNTTPALSRTTSRSFLPLAPSTQHQLSVEPPSDHSCHSHHQHNTSSQSHHLQIIPATRTVNTTPTLDQSHHLQIIPVTRTVNTTPTLDQSHHLQIIPATRAKNLNSRQSLARSGRLFSIY